MIQSIFRVNIWQAIENQVIWLFSSKSTQMMTYFGINFGRNIVQTYKMYTHWYHRVKYEHFDAIIQPIWQHCATKPPNDSCGRLTTVAEHIRNNKLVTYLDTKFVFVIRWQCSWHIFLVLLALNCVRLLSRVIPYIHEDNEWKDFFWSSLPSANENEPTTIPLAQSLLNAICVSVDSCPSIYSKPLFSTLTLGSFWFR